MLTLARSKTSVPHASFVMCETCRREHGGWPLGNTLLGEERIDPGDQWLGCVEPSQRAVSKHQQLSQTSVTSSMHDLFEHAVRSRTLSLCRCSACPKGCHLRHGHCGTVVLLEHNSQGWWNLSSTYFSYKSGVISKLKL